MPTIYKSTDPSAPVMNGSAGSLIAVLKACLVDGYGAKPAAGWSFVDVHAATYKALFTQGNATGRVNKKLYVEDSAASVGSAIAWGCTDCTISSSPVFTDNFWANSLTYSGNITKADQENGGASAWMVIADSRALILLTKRSEWVGRGWAFTFVGDLVSGMLVDKGCFAIAGWNTYDVYLTYGMAARAATNGYISVFGEIGGTRYVTYYPLRGAMGYASGAADLLYPVNAYNREAHITRVFAADSYKYRGHIPFLWFPVAPPSNFPLACVADSVDISDVTGTKILKHIHFGDSSNTRAFIEISGF